MIENIDVRDFERIREIVDRGGMPPLLPKSVIIDDTGNGVRVQITARGRGPIDGTVRFDVHYVADCDDSTTNGLARIVGASTVVDNIPNPIKEDALGETLVSDGKYRDGWFFITAVNAAGDRSEPSQPRQVGAAVHDRSVPTDVQHFRGSESGEQHNGMTFSACAFSYQAPNPLAGFDSLQLVAIDYPTRGEVTALDPEEYRGLGGGAASFKKLLQVCRRPGLGTVTATNGVATVTFGGSENALIQAQAGDYLEVLGVRAQIKSVDSATQVTLGVPGGAAANWSGLSVAAFAFYTFLGNVRFYARSVSAGGGYDEDLTGLPYVDLVLDGNLSAPNAPTLAVEAAGGLIRASVTLPAGTEIAEAILYRGTGAAVAFASCTPIKTWPSDQINPTATLQYEDTDFSAYEKENAQVFTYYAVAVNVRGEKSLPSAAAQATCRLNTGKEGDTPFGKLGLKNLLYNGFIGGTSGIQVAAGGAAGASQDVYFDVSGGTPGIAYNASSPQANGTGRWQGHTRWDASVGVTFNLGTEVLMPFPGAGNFATVWQEIGAWDNPLTRFRKIKRAGVYVLSAYFRIASGTPNGEIRFFLEQHNDAVVPKLGNAYRRYRDSADVLQWSNADYTFSASLLTAEWQRFWAVYRTDSTLANSRQIHVNLAWAEGTTGSIAITQAMLNEGEEVGVFTADMGDTWIAWPQGSGDPPNGVGDGDGTRVGRYIEA